MVNHTAIHHEAEIFDDECPETDYGNTTVVEQDGEFAWSTSKQGWILSSFFYGYVLTQVHSSLIFSSDFTGQISVSKS
jgi:MFS transporter, ACS family, solute carrier family 17 (sodium-dependent inorganic phosphate cotransporter), member 5